MVSKKEMCFSHHIFWLIGSLHVALSIWAWMSSTAWFALDCDCWPESFGLKIRKFLSSQVAIRIHLQTMVHICAADTSWSDASLTPAPAIAYVHPTLIDSKFFHGGLKIFQMLCAYGRSDKKRFVVFKTSWQCGHILCAGSFQAALLIPCGRQFRCKRNSKFPL